MADLLIGGDVDPATHQRNERIVKLASGDLTTHAVIVGMTGSGKTGLGSAQSFPGLDRRWFGRR